MNWAHLVRTFHPMRPVQGSYSLSVDGLSLNAPVDDPTAGDAGHAYHASLASSAQPSEAIEGTTDPIAQFSANGQSDTESGGNHRTDDSLPGSCPRNLVTNSDYTSGDDDAPGTWTGANIGTDPNCPSLCDLPRFFEAVVERWIEHWRDPNPPNSTPGHDGLESALVRLVQALASEFSDCRGFDPGSISSIPNDPIPQGAVAAEWHHTS
jgi:hypothetical protein